MGRTRRNTVPAVIWITFLLCATFAHAAYLRNVPQTLVQPDGQVLKCLASGDEYFNWLHDAAGYVILQDHDTGFYVYAQEVQGELLPTPYIAGRIDPSAVGLVPDIRPSAGWLQRHEMTPAFGPAGDLQSAPAAPSHGTINNIVIFIRFSGEPEFTDVISTYDGYFNTSAASMKNYFSQASYATLTINSTFYPPAGATVVSYQDAHDRNYYTPYSATNTTGYTSTPPNDRTTREHTLLQSAVNAVSASIPAGLNVDGDGNGYVDNVCFIIDGDPTAWSTLLWPHRWALYSVTANINGKRVWDYNFQLQSSVGVSVLCHEMFHSLGAPDLYHYYNGTSLYPVYTWDLMERNQSPPQSMGAYMKYRYGRWIASIPQIMTSGTYTLNPITSSTNNCYKIASSNSANEYFVVEYRKKAASGQFESAIPGSGLLVYRINTLSDGQGNANYPSPLDEVYIYRPGGTSAANGTPTSAHFTSDVGRTAINDSTNPACWLANSPNPGGLKISNVTAAGATISFDVTIPSGGGCTSPSISTHPRGQAISSGQTAGLSVGAGGTGPLAYHWYQGATGDTGTPVGTNSDTFTTPALTSSTSYWVRVTNTCGSADSDTAVVTVVTGGTGPAITLVKSKSYQPRSSATVYGSGFSTTASKDTLYFGSYKATVTKATATSLKTKIPKKCKRGPVDVYVVVNGQPSNLFTIIVK